MGKFEFVSLGPGELHLLTGGDVEYFILKSM